MNDGESGGLMPPADVLGSFRAGGVIPAHPLALKPERRLDEAHQRALSRYYLDAGAVGLAVGVHTTEFAIHEPKVGLYRPVLELAMEVARNAVRNAARNAARDAVRDAGPDNLRSRRQPPVMIAGVIGPTAQAVGEAQAARDLGYHIGLVGLGALREASDDQLMAHVRAIAAVIPVMGFYLQPAAGGRILAEGFWRRLAEVPNVVGIKIAPFNRYHTLAVMRAVAAAGRAQEIALYTGNDDSILLDLLSEYEIDVEAHPVRLGMVGGLLGHWAYWTHRAVEQLEQARQARRAGAIPGSLLTLAAQITESNEAVFDPEHSFRGCLAGILYVLARVGLVAGVYPLGREEGLSPGQVEKIERIVARYPHLTDDGFVRERLEGWLRP